MEDKGHSLLLPANAPKYITATLALMGITNITSIKKGQYLFANKLLVPYYLAGSGHIHPGRVREVKHFFTEKITAINPVDKIYVSRSRQKARRVVNEEQVIDTLKALDFKIIYFEDYTFEEQVAIGKGAQIMVSSHGANLTNCLFMPSGAKVLELIRYDQPNFCYWALASVAGLQYNYQLCKVVGNDHLLVDMELFKQNLKSLLNE
ncbi:MAG: glycosyltransferase family 61 protein [Bacteroidia bacterium]|nr:glycosyltransferase family 61 protein [Bacteroidia bacterium]